MADVFERLKDALSDRYSIEREIGQGGMSTVYLAEDLKHHRKVAVKVLRPELAAILGTERFLKEIEVTANLQHPHVLPLYDSGEADSFLYYVMPHVEGESLREKLNREKQLSVQETVEIAKSVAAALDYAHRHSVIHRDIKPENILVHDGQPVVADFGIALAISAAGGTRLTETGLSLGTPHYMSPEQATADRELDARTDVYSLGAVVYEMLVGEPPHMGNSAQAIVAKILSVTPAPISRTRELVPTNVEAAVICALAKSPADRFSSAAEFAAAIAHPAFTLPALSAAAATTDEPSTRRWQRVAFTSMVVCALLAVVALWGWLREEAPQPVSRYSIALPKGEGFGQTIWGSRLAMSPDGDKWVYVGRGSRGGQLWLRERDQLFGAPLQGTEGAFHPMFSPDGSRVAFFVGRPATKLRVVSLNDGQTITVVDSNINQGGGSWGGDGFIYVDGFLEGDGIARVPATGGALEAVTMRDTTRGEAWHIYPHALPNGKGILFTVDHGVDISESEIAVSDLAAGTQMILARGAVAIYAESGHLLYVTAAGTLMAAPFDQDALRLTGDAVALAEGLSVNFEQRKDLAVSADGTLMYVAATQGAAGGEYYWVTRDGVAEVIDTALTGMGPRFALSPDGTRLVLSDAGATEWHLWIKELDSGPIRRLTFEGGANEHPVWAPDGQSVMFTSVREVGEAVGLYLKRVDGGTAAQLVLSHERGVASGAWSADAEWVVYTTEEPYDIFALRPGVDTASVPLVATAAAETAFSLSPNDRWLAYVSNESGQDEVYVAPFPNTADGKWLVSRDGGGVPEWAHSGRELFYRNAAGELMVVEVTEGSGLEIGTPRMLFPAGDYWDEYAVSPDDQRFVMVRTPDFGVELIVVENFFEELKDKVGS